MGFCLNSWTCLIIIFFVSVVSIGYVMNIDGNEPVGMLVQKLNTIRKLLTLPSDNPTLAASQLVAFQQQIPALYGILIASTLLLAATHFQCAPPLLSIYIPVIGSVLCAIRILIWRLRTGKEASNTEAQTQLRSVLILTVFFGIVFTTWSLSLFKYGNAYQKFHVAFYMAITVISCIFCLMHLRSAALLLTAIVIVPFVTFFFLTGNPVFVAVALNVLLVSGGMIFILLRNYSDFSSLIKSQRELLVRQIETERLSDENFSLANLDSLTGLPNRRRFFANLDQVLIEAQRNHTRFALALFDLDGFKAVNDVYGHARGDQLLIEVGDRLRRVASPSLTLARIGGDEFGAILAGNPEDDEILALGNRLCNLLQGPYLGPNIMAEVAGSAGLVAYPNGAATAQQLFERADYALYTAKQERSGRAIIFSHDHETRIRETSRIEQALRHANLGDEMSLAYQPIYDVDSPGTIGYEALARWQSATLGNVDPDVFIPIAERARQIGRLTEILLTKALSTAASWPDSLFVSFNLSALDLVSRDTMEAVRRIVEVSGLAPGRIEFEVTETAAMRDFDQASEALAKLRQLGMRIALDDFGTGFSSLSHVHRLKPDKIKVDRSFVRDIEVNEASRKIIRTIIDMCRNLGLECVVEGVETEAQLSIVRSLGCHLIQGYLFGQPMTDTAVHQHTATGACLPRHLGYLPHITSLSGSVST